MDELEQAAYNFMNPPMSDKERFDTLKAIVNLDYQNRHDTPQMYFTWSDLKWMINRIEQLEKDNKALKNLISIDVKTKNINKEK